MSRREPTPGKRDVSILVSLLGFLSAFQPKGRYVDTVRRGAASCTVTEQWEFCARRWYARAEDCQSIRARYFKFPLFLIKTVGFYLYLFQMD